MNCLEVVRDLEEGISIKSNRTGKYYDLLEGKSFHGRCTSDIIFVMEADPENGYVRLVNYLFGASCEEDIIKEVLNLVEDYETGKRAPMQKDSIL